jgi:SnoaL-like polyketide cyclase
MPTVAPRIAPRKERPECRGDGAGSSRIRDLEVPRALVAGWEAIDPRARERVDTLFRGDRPIPSIVAVAVDGDCPPAFARDLACGGGAFREAFPLLSRRVVEIADATDSVVVRVGHEGHHTGTFFELVRPTYRTVCFEVVHRLVLDGALLREHRIVVDVRQIILQLVARTAPPSVSHAGRRA